MPWGGCTCLILFLLLVGMTLLFSPVIFGWLSGLGLLPATVFGWSVLGAACGALIGLVIGPSQGPTFLETAFCVVVCAVIGAILSAVIASRVL
jgi:hypothetical protein